MDIATIYAARYTPRPDLDPSIADIIAKLKISFKPTFRKPFPPARRRQEREEAANWREHVLVDVVRKVREKDDADYDEINAVLNKLSKDNYGRLKDSLLTKLSSRDEMFRLRVTTLVFDRGLHQIFFAPLLADAYADIIKTFPDASNDLATQITMVDRLYEIGNVTVIPNSSDAGYDDAVIAWTKQKEKKRGFAVFLAELYSRGLVAEDTMTVIVQTIVLDLQETARLAKTPPHEEHVDALVRFLFAVAAKVNVKASIQAVLGLSRAETPSLTMKSRFKLQDCLALK